VSIAAAAAARCQADATDDVLVEEAEDGGHERAEMGDRQQCQRNADDRVRDRDEPAQRRLGRYVAVAYTRWRRGVVVSGVRRMNEVIARRARLVPGWVTVFGRVYHLGM